ncbi:MAG: RNA polymerase sigma factor [Flavobacteriales bacterium]|nr:RNA polymerase sigma factor [Flavobacteriales bacterium]
MHARAAGVPAAPVDVVEPAPTVCGQRDAGMDVAAYNRVVDACSDMLYRHLLRDLRDRDAAKDLVQESFLRLWMKLDRVPESAARSYLFTTAHNLVVDRVRRSKRSARFEDRHEQMLTTLQPKAGLKELIDAAQAKLSPLHRTLFQLRDQEGYSYQEIAANTGMDITRVKVYLFRARKAMQGHLGPLEQLV